MFPALPGKTPHWRHPVFRPHLGLCDKYFRALLKHIRKADHADMQLFRKLLESEHTILRIYHMFLHICLRRNLCARESAIYRSMACEAGLVLYQVIELAWELWECPQPAMIQHHRALAHLLVKRLSTQLLSENQVHRGMCTVVADIKDAIASHCANDEDLVKDNARLVLVGGTHRAQEELSRLIDIALRTLPETVRDLARPVQKALTRRDEAPPLDPFASAFPSPTPVAANAAANANATAAAMPYRVPLHTNVIRNYFLNAFLEVQSERALREELATYISNESKLGGLRARLDPSKNPMDSIASAFLDNVQAGRIERVRSILTSFPQPPLDPKTGLPLPSWLCRCFNADGIAALHIAAREGNAPLFRLLVEVGRADPNRTLPLSRISALHVACMSPHAGAAEIVEYLLFECHVDVEARTELQQTPMFQAALSGNERALELLFCRGARAYVVNREGRMPIQVADARVADRIRKATLDELHAARKQGDAHAAYILGRCYAQEGTRSRMEIHVETNMRFAFRMLKEAAHAGLQEAFLPLGDCYSRGFGTAVNLTAAARCWLVASLPPLSHPEACASVSTCFAQGIFRGLAHPVSHELAWNFAVQAGVQGIDWPCSQFLETSRREAESSREADGTIPQGKEEYDGEEEEKEEEEEGSREISSTRTDRGGEELPL